MRRWGGLLLLVGLLAGCSDDETPDNEGGPAAEVTLAADDALNQRLSEGLTSVAWSVDGELDAARTTITIVAEGGGCIRVERAVVQEDDDRVVIGALAKDVREPGVECTAELAYVPLNVDLRESLGDRALVHLHPTPP